MSIILILIHLYIIGCVFALLIYDVYFYEKYNGKILDLFNQKDYLQLLNILFSWMAFCYIILKLRKINLYK